MPFCRHCGCSDLDPCLDPDTDDVCSWIEVDEDQRFGNCSFCVDAPQVPEPEILAPSRELILPGDPDFHL